MANLLDSVTQLCVQTRKFHGSKREKNLNSLLVHINEFKSIDERGFTEFICNRYIRCLYEKKRFCAASIYNIISAVQNRNNVLIMTRRQFDMLIRNLRKLFNPYDSETTYFTNTGMKINLPLEEVNRLRENARLIMHQNKTSAVERSTLSTYTDAEAEELYAYFLAHLQNALRGGVVSTNTTIKNSEFMQLCLLVTFMYNTPRRVGELLNLNMAQVKSLMDTKSLDIKTKDGYEVDSIYISDELAFLLRDYVENFKANASDQDKLFTLTYKMCHTRMQHVIKSLFARTIKRPFHGFRNYFASKHIGTDLRNTSRLLGHRNVMTTRRYAYKHGNKNHYAESKEAALKFINKI